MRKHQRSFTSQFESPILLGRFKLGYPHEACRISTSVIHRNSPSVLTHSKVPPNWLANIREESVCAYSLRALQAFDCKASIMSCSLLLLLIVVKRSGEEWFHFGSLMNKVAMVVRAQNWKLKLFLQLSVLRSLAATEYVSKHILDCFPFHKCRNRSPRSQPKFLSVHTIFEALWQKKLDADSSWNNDRNVEHRTEFFGEHVKVKGAAVLPEALLLDYKLKDRTIELSLSQRPFNGEATRQPCLRLGGIYLRLSIEGSEGRWLDSYKKEHPLNCFRHIRLRGITSELHSIHNSLEQIEKFSKVHEAKRDLLRKTIISITDLSCRWILCFGTICTLPAILNVYQWSFEAIIGCANCVRWEFGINDS